MHHPDRARRTILQTQRLRLRLLVPGDLEALYALYRDPEVRQYFPQGTLNYQQTKEELEWFLNGHPDYPELGLWATLLEETGELIGRCGLLPWKIEDRLEVEVAYLIAKPYWGQGLATEAAQAIARYAFGELGLSRLIALIDPANQPSRRVAEKIGMTLEREVEGIEGDGIPTLIYAMSKPG